MKDYTEGMKMVHAISHCINAEGLATSIPEHHAYVAVFHNNILYQVYHYSGMVEIWQNSFYLGRIELANPQCFQTMVTTIKEWKARKETLYPTIKT